MVAAKILIVAAHNDLHALAVIDRLAHRNVATLLVDFAAIHAGTRLTLDIRSGAVTDAVLVTGSGETVCLSELETVWWRRPMAPKEDLSLDEEARSFVRTEWNYFLDGVEAVSSCRWINSPSAARTAENKALQLTIASQCGLRIPQTAFSNDPMAVRTLAEKCQEMIYKRVSPATRPRTATKKVESADFSRLDVLPNCPAIFQEYIPARVDVRVTAIGTALHAAEIDSQSGHSPIDWRLDQSVDFKPHQLDDAIVQGLRTLMKRLGLVYGAIDLRLTPDGEYVFLEVNPNGQYMFVELLAGIPLSEEMASFLTYRKSL